MNGRLFTPQELDDIERMRTVEGRSFEEIGARTGRTPQSIKQQCARWHFYLAPHVKRVNAMARARRCGASRVVSIKRRKALTAAAVRVGGGLTCGSCGKLDANTVYWLSVVPVCSACVREAIGLLLTSRAPHG